MKPFVSVMRAPDFVVMQTEGEDVRFEERQVRAGDAAVRYEVGADGATVWIDPSASPVRYVKLRWEGDFSFARLVYRDDWARGDHLAWSTVVPHALNPWYIHVYDGERTHSWGVATGPNAFCAWQVDPFGLSLWIDARCGNAGVALTGPLAACRVLEREGVGGESPWEAARAFCRAMCPKPVLPETPVFGANDWYWAYGEISHERTLRETDYLMSLCEGTAHRPFMVIDDGWEVARYRGLASSYNGGPWDRTNAAFPAGTMRRTAEEIARRGARPGIWFRPLLTLRALPEGVELVRPGGAYNGQIADPSHPFTLDMVREDVTRLREWGFELIKHDFSAYDALGRIVPDGTAASWRFHDATKTSAQIMKALYSAIQEAAGGALVLGCDVFGHLSAGIHALQRVGADTSGRSFEWTRRYGVNTFLRLPQNGAFFRTDPDCAAFTSQVPHDLNLDFMEACAITGSAVIASITPNSLAPAEVRRAREIYALADRGGGDAEPLDWLWVNAPSRYRWQGREYAYNWYAHYRGTREILTWTR